MKKKKNILLVFVLLIVLIISLYANNIFIVPINKNSNRSLGIIDGSLFNKHNNITEIHSTISNVVSSKQHGDYILEFLSNVAPNISFFYYNAEIGGEITSDNIIDGLQWMADLNVDCVTISLSSKHYSEELENWISNNSDKIEIYASYNNTLNSFDYPAQYESVIGIGTFEVVNSKNINILYKSNNIIVISSGLKRYSGNSYLTPYTMLKSGKNFRNCVSL